MEPSEIINLARSVGADYLLMVKGMKPYNRAYKRHDVKSFPRNVIVFNDGKLNKVANQLFAEFYSYVEVA